MGAAVVVVQAVEDGCCFELYWAENEQMEGSGAPGGHDGGDGACDLREYQHRERHHSMRVHSLGLRSHLSRGHDRGHGNRGRRHMLRYEEFGGRGCWGYRALRYSNAGTLQQVFRRACRWMPGGSRGENNCAEHEAWSSSSRHSCPSCRSVRSVGCEGFRLSLGGGGLLVAPFGAGSRR